MPPPTCEQELQRIAAALQHAEENEDTHAQIRLYRELLKLTPQLAIAHAALARALVEIGDESAARPHIEFALSQPQDDKVDRCLFGMLIDSGYFTGNLEQARTWFEESPSLTRFSLLYSALTKADAKEEIEQYLHYMLEKETAPEQQSQLLTLLAQLYYSIGRFHDSIACYKLGLEQTPGNPTQLFNLALALEQVGNYKDALELYQAILRKNPEHIGTHNNLAMLLLRLGQFPIGWQQYEWRWQATQKEHYEHFSIPRWNGEPLDDKTLLVWGEQGVGDHIMFASMLDEVRQLCGKLHYEIYARLDPIFKRSFPEVNFIRREQQGEEDINGRSMFKQIWPSADYQIPIGSLPAILRRSREEFPAQERFLYANKEMTEQFSNDYRTLFSEKRLIGVSWRGGNSINNESQSRRIPLAALDILARLPNVQLINLQYGDTHEELREAMSHGISIYNDDRVNPKLDLESQAAQIAALDAVVSIDNTTVHLAGAIGAPTYALLPLNPSFRWGLEEGISYWYGRVQLFRNRTIDDWSEVLQRVIDQMQADGIV